jgi:endo-1,4-beta-xylanase
LPPALKDTFGKNFLIGAAVNTSQVSDGSRSDTQLLKRNFNSITPENSMKWQNIHPQPDQYEFAEADRYVDFGEKNGMFVIGHTLVWHSQTPDWVFKDASGKPASRELLLERLEKHIRTVMGRYKGRVKGWDVVNEALSDDGSLRKSQWLEIIGEDYIVKAFEFAHAADPDAELYYNDYSLEDSARLKGAVALIRMLQAKGVKVTGIGSQSHAKMDWPTSKMVDDTLTTLGELGIKVMITELDVDVLPPASSNHGADVSLRIENDPKLNPYAAGLPESAQAALANRYAELFAVYVKHSAIVERVTFWGVTDSDSWLNDWPVRGRLNYPLLFDRAAKPKPAFSSVIRTVSTNP